MLLGTKSTVCLNNLSLVQVRSSTNITNISQRTGTAAMRESSWNTHMNSSSQSYSTQHIQKDKDVLQRHGKSLLMLKNLSKFVINTEVAALQNQQVLTHYTWGTEKKENYTDHNHFINNVRSLCSKSRACQRWKCLQSFFFLSRTKYRGFYLPF